MKLINLFKNVKHNESAKEAVNSSFDYETIDIESFGPVFIDISRKLPKVNVSKIDLSIEDFDKDKVDANMYLLNKLMSKSEPISIVDVSCNNINKTSERNLYIVARVFCLSIEDDVVKYTIKARCKYESINSDNDNNMINLAVEYINGFIRSKALISECQHKVYINNIYEYDYSVTENYSGYIKRFSKNLDKRVSTNEEINIDIDEIMLDNDEDYVVDVIHKSKTKISDII